MAQRAAQDDEGMAHGHRVLDPGIGPRATLAADESVAPGRVPCRVTNTTAAAKSGRLITAPMAVPPRAPRHNGTLRGGYTSTRSMPPALALAT